MNESEMGRRERRGRAGARLSSTYTVIPGADFTLNMQPPAL